MSVIGEKTVTGSSNFKALMSKKALLVDKSLFVKAFVERDSTVDVILRPRRFGKSFALSMLEQFLGLNADKNLFVGCKINEHEEFVDAHFGKYPVLRLDFKTRGGPFMESVTESLATLIKNLLRKYSSDSFLTRELLEQHDPLCLPLYDVFLSGMPSEVDLQDSLLFLTELLYRVHEKKVILLIDEFDAPLADAFRNGYYVRAAGFMERC